MRNFLSQTLPKVIISSRFVPDWLRELADNPGLLTDNPCARYTVAAASGDTIAIDRLRKELSIPEESWFWKELILSQVRHICTLDNSEYLVSLDTMLALLEGQMSRLLSSPSRIKNPNPVLLSQPSSLRKTTSNCAPRRCGWMPIRHPYYQKPYVMMLA